MRRSIRLRFSERSRTSCTRYACPRLVTNRTFHICTERLLRARCTLSPGWCTEVHGDIDGLCIPSHLGPAGKCISEPSHRRWCAASCHSLCKALHHYPCPIPHLLSPVNRVLDAVWRWFQAFDASRVEEEHQIEENGFVEDGHDTTRAHTLVKLTSISNFLWLLPESRLPDLAVVRQQHSSKRRHREVSRQSLMEELVGSERAASMGSGAGFAPRPGRRSVGDMLLENMDNVEKAVEGTGKQPKVTDYMVSGVSDARHLVSEQRLMAELEEELAASERAQTIEGSTVPSTEDESKSGKQ